MTGKAKPGLSQMTLRADVHEVESIISLASAFPTMEDRLGVISRHFLGRPYLSNPLVGSAAEREQLVTRLDGFDCVTFVESVVALARSRRPEDYERELAALRYEGGRVDWLTRNHYTSDWIARNVAAGLLLPLLAEHMVAEDRLLCALEHYPSKKQRFCYLPRDRIRLLEGTARTGDVVCFVSTRRELDIFHLGLLTSGRGIYLRHASRSAGMVIEEPLEAFLDRNETPGLLAARPADH